jgi:hypothetical protein
MFFWLIEEKSWWLITRPPPTPQGKGSASLRNGPYFSDALPYALLRHYDTRRGFLVTPLLNIHTLQFPKYLQRLWQLCPTRAESSQDSRDSHSPNVACFPISTVRKPMLISSPKVLPHLRTLGIYLLWGIMQLMMVILTNFYSCISNTYSLKLHPVSYKHIA